MMDAEEFELDDGDTTMSAESHTAGPRAHEDHGACDPDGKLAFPIPLPDGELGVEYLPMYVVDLSF